MQKIRLFLVLMCIASVLSFVSCGTEAKTKNPRTVITGQIINRTMNDSPTIICALGDPFTLELVLSAELPEDGSFRMETQEVSLLCNNMLFYNDAGINFFIAPGDSIHVIIDAAKLPTGVENAVRFEGDRAEHNNELLGCYDYISKIAHSDLYNNKLNMDVEPAAMIVQLNERLDMYQDSLAVYEKRQKVSLSADLKDFIRRDNTFILALRLSDYKQGNTKLQSELFNDPFFGMDDSQNFITISFHIYLDMYMNTNVYGDTTVSAAFDRSDFTTGIRNGIHILMIEPASPGRDVMMWKLLSNHIGSHTILYDSIPEIQTMDLFTDARLDAKLANFARKLANVVPVTPIEEVSYLESDGTEIKLPKGDIFAHLAHKHPGKVLYIDIYATWCVPCLNEMKNHVPALHEAMKGKDVVFVNLCLDSDNKDWLNIAEQYNIKENYLLDDNASTIFSDAYNIAGYPTYILVGKDGKIATMHAERPSNLDDAVKQIEELLEE